MIRSGTNRFVRLFAGCRVFYFTAPQAHWKQELSGAYLFKTYDSWEKISPVLPCRREVMCPGKRNPVLCLRALDLCQAARHDRSPPLEPAPRAAPHASAL